MEFISGLALVLLALVGYSIGAVIGARDRSPTPQLLDLAVVIVLWIAAFFSRPALGKWAAISVWLIVGGLVSLMLNRARRNRMPSKPKTAVSSQGNGFFRRLWEGWKGFAAEMGNYQSRILLAFFYFLVITPFGVLVRLFGDLLKTRSLTYPSFWNNRTTISSGLDEARRQF